MVIPSGFRFSSPPDCTSPVAFLYFLRCPKSDEVRYVGSAANPVGRYRTHISEAKKNLKKTQVTTGWCAAYSVYIKGSEKEQWVCRLLEESLLPVLEVVACVPLEFVVVAEAQLYDSCAEYGYRLVNGVRPNDSQTRRLLAEVSR